MEHPGPRPQELLHPAPARPTLPGDWVSQDLLPQGPDPPTQPCAAGLAPCPASPSFAPCPASPSFAPCSASPSSTPYPASRKSAWTSAWQPPTGACKSDSHGVGPSPHHCRSSTCWGRTSQSVWWARDAYHHAVLPCQFRGGAIQTYSPTGALERACPGMNPGSARPRSAPQYVLDSQSASAGPHVGLHSRPHRRAGAPKAPRPAPIGAE